MTNPVVSEPNPQGPILPREQQIDSEAEALRAQLKQAQRREAELLVQLDEAKLDSESSRTARLAALNLMEDAIISRRAEQQQNAERLRAELAFKRSETRFKALFESMSEACCVLERIDDPPAFDFRFVEANTAFRLQSQHDDVLGKSVCEVLVEGTLNWAHFCQKVFAGNQPLKREQQLFGRHRHFEISAFKISHDDRQQVVLLLTDITERKESEAAQTEAARLNEQLVRMENELVLLQVRREASEAVRGAEERFRAFIDQNPAAAFIKDGQGRYVFVNHALEVRSGRNLEDWLGKTDFDFFPHDDAEQYRRNEQSVLTTKNAAQFHESCLEADGRHEYLSYKFPMRDNDGSWFVAATAFDVTQQKRAEAALALNEQRLRALAAEISKVEYQERRRMAGILHEEVQQLLIAIQLRAALIESRVTDSAIKQQALAVNELVATAIDTVRSLSRELVPPTLYQLGLAAGLEWLAGRFQQQYGLKVEVIAAEDTDPNSDMLRDVIFNIARELLLNIVKHAHTDHAKVTLRRESTQLRLVVSDEGVGLDPHEDWQRKDSFGLFQIRERLYSMGGSLELKSSPGKGVEVCALIPMNEPIAV